MKTYLYNKKQYFLGVVLTGYFCIFIIIMATILMVLNYLTGLMIVVIIVAFYTIWNSFISNSNPSKVIIGDDYISFHSFNRKDIYFYEEIEQLRIREFPSSGKMFIRVNDAGILKGRYWLQTKMFDEGKELFVSLLNIEYCMFPDTLKGRARSVNTEYLQIQKQKNKTEKKG
ncbi:MAG: hypothetical protein ACK5KR_06725 [Breznakia sp.]